MRVSHLLLERRTIKADKNHYTKKSKSKTRTQSLRTNLCDNLSHHLTSLLVQLLLDHESNLLEKTYKWVILELVKIDMAKLLTLRETMDLPSHSQMRIAIFIRDYQTSNQIWAIPLSNSSIVLQTSLREEAWKVQLEIETYRAFIWREDRMPIKL